MAEARLYQNPKSSMQSGRGRTQGWTLEFASTDAKRADPLTGWAGGGETIEQVRLSFPDRASAEAYAARSGIAVSIVPAPERVLKLQAYADNFR